MTKAEAVLAETGVNIPNNILNKVFIDHNIDGSTDYTPEDAKSLASVSIDCLLRSSFYSSISEGGYSISYDKKYIDMLLKLLALKAGRTDVFSLLNAQPKIKAVRRW